MCDVSFARDPTGLLVCHLALRDLPTRHEMARIARAVRARLDVDPLAVHVEHVSDHAIPVPSLRTMHWLARLLSDHSPAIRANLLGTIVQTRELSPLTRWVLDTGRALYRPTKPVSIVETAAAARAALDALSTSSAARQLDDPRRIGGGAATASAGDGPARVPRPARPRRRAPARPPSGAPRTWARGCARRRGTDAPSAARCARPARGTATR